MKDNKMLTKIMLVMLYFSNTTARDGERTQIPSKPNQRVKMSDSNEISVQKQRMTGAYHNGTPHTIRSATQIYENVYNSCTHRLSSVRLKVSAREINNHPDGN